MRPKATCTVSDCDEPRHGDGLCDRHYRRKRRTGSTEQASVLATCVRCGEAFEYTHHRRTLCSDECRTENRREIHARSREVNKEKRAAYDRERGHDRTAGYARYRRENREAINERARAARAASPEKFREADRRWKAKNPLKVLHRTRLQRAKRAGVRIYEFTLEELDLRLSMFAGCWVCAGSASEIDHVKPLTKEGPHMLANIRPICRACNNRKRNRWPFAA